MKKGDFNIMTDIKIIEQLKSDLLLIIAEFFRLLTRGSNIAQEAIMDCISSAIILLYILGDRLGYSYSQIDENMKQRLKVGIVEEDLVEKSGKDLSRLSNHLDDRL